jgi:hypothetical protein
LDKLDWLDPDFKAFKDGSIIDYYDGDKVLINYTPNRGKVTFKYDNSTYLTFVSY